MTRTRRNLWRSALLHLRPPPDLTPSQWAERHVRIPMGNAIPGPIRFDNAPYQREPLDLIDDPDCKRITLMWGAQVGKTQVFNCAIGYYIAAKPCSQIVMQPSEGDHHVWQETKLTPLIESTPMLQDRVATPRGRTGVNNTRMKSYPGGWLMFSWAGSTKTMRQRSAPKVYCDEIDGYDATEEGDPVELLRQRSATFGDQRTLFETSTPTIKDASPIERAFLEGDQRRYWIPCPHCGTMQTLKWANVLWSKDDDGTHLPETALYHCEHCGSGITDAQKLQALRKGEWRSSKPYRGHASYHLSELYSAFRRWSDIAQSFLDKRAKDDLQSFVNVSLAETWEEESERADPLSLIQRAEKYKAAVPSGAVVLTAGIDMQTDRLEVEIVGWGVGEESWSIDYRVLWGSPDGVDVWEQLDDVLSETFVHESGAVLPIYAAALDTGGTGGHTQRAYEYARGKTRRRLFAIKGVGGWGRPVVAAPSRKQSGRRSRKVDLFPVGTDEAKLIVMRRLVRTTTGPGFCHFPDDREAEWFHQLTAETLRTRYVKGHPKREWHLRRDRNEALDCRVYALAALKIANPSLRRHAERIAEIEPDDEADDAGVEQAEQADPRSDIDGEHDRLADVLATLQALKRRRNETAPEETATPTRQRIYGRTGQRRR